MTHTDQPKSGYPGFSDTDPTPLRIWTGINKQTGFCVTAPTHDMQVIGWAYSHDRDYNGVSDKYAVTLQCRICLVRTDLNGRIL